MSRLVHRLSPRERKLALATGAVVFLLLNLALLSAFARKTTALRTDYAQAYNDHLSMQELLSQQALWEKREAWLSEKQPKLVNENAAGVELLDFTRTVAKNAEITITNPAIGSLVRSPFARSISVTMETHSSWPNLIKFLQTMQRPDQFIVFENVHVQVDPADPTRMFGTFKIARWYAL